MATTLDPEPTTDDGDGGPRIPWRSVVACLATALLGFGLALFVSRDRPPSGTSVDVRFLQDMRFHHEQAVGMSLLLLDQPVITDNAVVRSIAREIVQAQAFEGGRMGQLLTSFRAAVANEGDTAMEWMGITPVPLGEMPGMASADDTAALQAATGADADKLYVRLMIAHHEGGILMAQYAQLHAQTQTVRDLASSMIEAQQSEIDELQSLKL